MASGRNFDEVLRTLDSLQLTASQPVAMPVNWTQGGDVIIVSSVSDEQAREKSPSGWKAPKPYLRIVAQPLKRLNPKGLGNEAFSGEPCRA
jgi:thioredoxin-dependent peroxiredoxin